MLMIAFQDLMVSLCLTLMQNATKKPMNRPLIKKMKLSQMQLKQSKCGSMLVTKQELLFYKHTEKFLTINTR